jgi:hypothetical protein
VDGVRLDGADGCCCATGHEAPYFFLTPYWERAFLRSTHAGGVERAADDLVATPGQVLDAPAADEHDRVLLRLWPSPGM